MAVSTFEGLPTGAVTAASAGFDFISNPAGGGSQVISTNPYRGTRCLQLTTGSAGAICYAERSASLGAASTGALFGRLRFRVPVLPADTTGMRIMVVADSTGAFLGDLRVINSGKLQLRSGAAALVAASTLTLVADTWVDVGIAVLVFSTTVGQLQMRIWDSAGAVSETLTSTATLNTLGSGGTNKAQVGAVRSGVNVFTVVVDDVDWSTSDYPTVTATNSGAAALAAGSGLTAGGVAVGAAAAVLTAGTALTAVATRSTTTGVELSGASTLTGVGQRAALGAVVLGGAGTLTAAAAAGIPAAVGLTAAGALNTTAVAAVPGAAHLTGVSSLVAGTTGSAPAAAALSGAATLTTVATRLAPTAGPALTGVSSLTGSTTAGSFTAVALSASTVVTVGGLTTTAAAQAALSAVGGLTATGSGINAAAADVTAASTLTASASISTPSTNPARGTVTHPERTHTRIRAANAQVNQPRSQVVIR